MILREFGDDILKMMTVTGLRRRNKAVPEAQGKVKSPIGRISHSLASLKHSSHVARSG